MQKRLVIILSWVMLLPVCWRGFAVPVLAQVPSADSTWRAVGELVASQAVLHGLGRYVMNEPFSQTTMKSIRHNLKSSFAWDDDNFYVNNAGHAYQGSLMFNAARSNGFGFWQSVPFTTAGSLLWEYFGENEQPSINDMLTTTFVGSFVGEMTHRLSREIVDERATGFNRFVREAAAAIVNPIEGFHRIVNGRAWKVNDNENENGLHGLHGLNGLNGNGNVNGAFAIGFRYLFPPKGDEAKGDGKGSLQPCLNLSLEYGEAADGESHTAPFDYFSADASLAFGKKQHLLSHLYLAGLICSVPIADSNNTVGELGLYQHFVYEDTHLGGDSLTRGPFPFGEMVSLGPGLQFHMQAPRLSLDQRLYAKGIALGAIESDYYKFYNRHYNMGSGYGVYSQSRLTWGRTGTLQLRAGYMHLYTWRGYEPRDLSTLTFDTNYLNVLGDRSNARLLSLSLRAGINVTRSLQATLGMAYYHRNTHYKYHPNHHAESYETRATLSWHF